MKNFEKSKKLNNVHYEIRGNVMVEADNMIKNNINVLKLNIGNPATFGFKAPDNLINKIFKNMDKAQGYSVSQGIYEARIEIKKYCNSKKY